jgi:hypothetical protein
MICGGVAFYRNIYDVNAKTKVPAFLQNWIDRTWNEALDSAKFEHEVQVAVQFSRLRMLFLGKGEMCSVKK